MGTHPIFESDFDCLTVCLVSEISNVFQCECAKGNSEKVTLRTQEFQLKVIQFPRFKQSTDVLNVVLLKCPKTTYIELQPKTCYKRTQKKVDLFKHDLYKLEQELGHNDIEMYIRQMKMELRCARSLADEQPWGEIFAPAPTDQWKWPI